MDIKYDYDVIIIGGSYAGLSAAMALGRSLRKILIIDGGLPCNRQTPHSHNFITQDGEKPHVIASKAREQVLQYKTVNLVNGLAVEAVKLNSGFRITTDSVDTYTAKKLIFATGIKDIMPEIDGFPHCWGISVIHCPYCHGYEVKSEVTGILANGDAAMHYAMLIRNLTDKLTIYTNGKATFDEAQRLQLDNHNIKVVEREIKAFDHNKGQLKSIIFKDETSAQLTALYAKVDFVQHTDLLEKLGCQLTEQGFIETNNFQQTSVADVYACGDNTSPMRSVANSVAAGNFAGAMVNMELCKAEF
ncbi:NAD(P)/FAD-dependent oxidoreductase [Fulvivirga ligni]|uniref:NAD(P)/FAD-dependent oxidoreductase n=1 Tax=Fulvivirga ligni TaxID=2904246 RepID=UPI001F1A43D0|nr:NAD(P)/FAD-dependent oxidoreductase [Fulvivirga ligni]UII20316.1 NAD(P)/FAD-dependent oxidoreductase [Fulvivirga ligni]